MDTTRSSASRVASCQAVSGSGSPLALQAVANAGYTIVMWSVCPWEWQGTEAQVYER